MWVHKQTRKVDYVIFTLGRDPIHHVVVTPQRSSSSATNETGAAKCQAFGLHDGRVRA
jgi:hypothetical protein